MSRTLRRVAFVLVPLIAALGMQTPASAGSATPLAAKKLKLLWSQDFNGKSGTAPDKKIWGYDLGNGSGGWGNGELEYYTKTAAKMNGAGQLVITAKKTPQEAIDAGGTPQYPYICMGMNDTNDVCPWSSARINTKGKIGFQYGRVEARIQMPEGDGMWPAFWMLGGKCCSIKQWPDAGEIDIVEIRGGDPFTVIGTIHGPGYSGSEGRWDSWSPTTAVSAGFHTYAIEWAKNKISWYFDKKLYYTMTPSKVAPNAWPFNGEFYLIANVAVGGAFVGYVVDPGLERATMKIDYIKYYSINGVGKVIKH